MAKTKSAKKNTDREIIQIVVEGEEAERFRAYKKLQHLRMNSEAGRKLFFERLEQVEKERAA